MNPELTKLQLFVYVGQTLGPIGLVHHYASVPLTFEFDDALLRKHFENEISYVGLQTPLKPNHQVGNAAVVRYELDQASREPINVEYVMDYAVPDSPIVKAWLSLWEQSRSEILVQRFVNWVPSLRPLLERLQERKVDAFLRQVPRDARLFVLSNIYRDALNAD